LGGNVARNSKRRRMTPEHISQAIAKDAELQKLFGEHATFVATNATYGGNSNHADWSWRPQFSHGGLVILPSGPIPTQLSTPPSPPLSYSLFEYVCRSLDYLAMIGSHLSRMKLQEDQWRRYYLNHFYPSRSHIEKEKKEMKEIGSSSSTPTATPKWRDILIDVYNPTSFASFVDTRPSTTIFPSEKHDSSIVGSNGKYVIPTIIRLSNLRKVNEPSIVDQSKFESRWNELSEGMFIGFDWSNVFAAG
jgi:hypothetical protein